MHILAAMTVVGGTFFVRLALVPAAQELPSTEHEKLRHTIRAKWAKWVHLSIAFLLISGVYNLLFVILPHKAELPGYYHPVFGIKFLLALGIFFIGSMLMGRSAASERMRKNQTFWLTINSVLVVVLVCLSGVLKVSHSKPPTPVTTPTPAENSTPTP